MVHVMEVEEVKEAVEETPEELLWDSLVLQAGTIASWWDQGLALTPGALGALGPWNPGVLGALQKAGKSSHLLTELSVVPGYQAALLLTEHHLMQGDSALAPGLRQALASIASENIRGGGEDMAARGHHESVLGSFDKGEVAVLVRDWGKVAILQRVERVLAIKPWALNRFHIQEMQAIGLSISEIIQCVLILAHFHAMAGLSQGLNLKPNQNSSQQRTKPRSLSLQQHGLRARPLNNNNNNNNKMAKRRRWSSATLAPQWSSATMVFSKVLCSQGCTLLSQFAARRTLSRAIIRKQQVSVQPDWSVPGTTLDFQFSAASVRLPPWSLTIGLLDFHIETGEPHGSLDCGPLHSTSLAAIQRVSALR